MVRADSISEETLNQVFAKLETKLLRIGNFMSDMKAQRKNQIHYDFNVPQSPRANNRKIEEPYGSKQRKRNRKVNRTVMRKAEEANSLEGLINRQRAPSSVIPNIPPGSSYYFRGEAMEKLFRKPEGDAMGPIIHIGDTDDMKSSTMEMGVRSKGVSQVLPENDDPEWAQEADKFREMMSQEEEEDGDGELSSSSSIGSEEGEEDEGNGEEEAFDGQDDE